MVVSRREILFSLGDLFRLLLESLLLATKGLLLAAHLGLDLLAAALPAFTVGLKLFNLVGQLRNLGQQFGRRFGWPGRHGDGRRRHGGWRSARNGWRKLNGHGNFDRGDLDEIAIVEVGRGGRTAIDEDGLNGR